TEGRRDEGTQGDAEGRRGADRRRGSEIGRGYSASADSASDAAGDDPTVQGGAAGSELSVFQQIGDINDDRVPDYIISGRGSATGDSYILLGPVDRNSLNRVDSADVNNDNVNDLLVRGEGYNFEVTFDTDAQLEGGAGSFRVGGRAAIVVDGAALGRPADTMGDVDGDGLADLILVKQTPGSNDWVVRVILGRTPADGGFDRFLDATDVDYMITLPSAIAVSVDEITINALDWNNDGRDDVLVQWQRDANLTNGIQVGMLFSGQTIVTTVNLTQAHASTRIRRDNLHSPGGGAISDLTSVAAGDVNGDGFEDLLFGDQRFTAGTPNTGRAYLVLGRAAFAAEIHLDNASAALVQSDYIWSGVGLGAGVFALGDTNQDGYDDFALTRSVSGPTAQADRRDGVIVYGGGPNLVVQAAAAPPVLNSANNELVRVDRNVPTGFHAHGDMFVYAGDFDGDARTDLAIGEPVHHLAVSAAEVADAALVDSSGGYLHVFWSALDVPVTTAVAGDAVQLSLAYADVQIEGEAGTDRFGTLPLSPDIDLDGDRINELIVGAAAADVRTGVAGNGPNDVDRNAGRIYVVFGGTGRDAALPESGVTFMTNRDVPGGGLFVVDPATGQPFRGELSHLEDAAIVVGRDPLPIDGRIGAGMTASFRLSLEGLTPEGMGLSDTINIANDPTNQTAQDLVNDIAGVFNNLFVGSHILSTVIRPVLDANGFLRLETIGLGTDARMTVQDVNDAARTALQIRNGDTGAYEFDDWHRFGTLGDGQIGNQIRVLIRDPESGVLNTSRPALEAAYATGPAAGERAIPFVTGTRLPNGTAAVVTPPAFFGASLEVGGAGGRIGIMEFDLTDLLGYLDNPELISNVQLQMLVAHTAGASQNRGTLSVFLLDDKADAAVTAVDVTRPAEFFEELEQRFLTGNGWPTSTAGTPFSVTLDLTQHVRDALAAGKTRVTLRLESDTPFPLFIEGFAAGRSELSFDVDTRGGVVVEVFDGDGHRMSGTRVIEGDFDGSGERVEAGAAVVDMRDFDSGEYFVRVYDPFEGLYPDGRSAALDYVIEIAPPKLGDADVPSERDEIYGEDGNDFIVGNGYVDRIYGGAGIETLTAEAIEVRDPGVVTGDPAIDDLLPPNIEVVTLPAPGEDSGRVARPDNFEVEFANAGFEFLIADALGLTTLTPTGTERVPRPLLATDMTQLLELNLSNRGLVVGQIVEAGGVFVGTDNLLGLDYAVNLEYLSLDRNLLQNVGFILPGIRPERETQGELGLRGLRYLDLDYNPLVPQLNESVLGLLELDPLEPVTILRGMQYLSLDGISDPITAVQSPGDEVPGDGTGIDNDLDQDHDAPVLGGPDGTIVSSNDEDSAGGFDAEVVAPVPGDSEFAGGARSRPQGGTSQSLLSWIDDLTQLRWLNATNTGTEDFEPLRDLDALQYAFLGENNFADVPSAGVFVLNVFAGAHNLRWLDLSGSDVGELRDLLGLYLVDDNDREYAEQGPGWVHDTNSSAFGGDYRVLFNGSSDSQAAAAFDGLGEAAYEVFATWPADRSRSPVQYAVTQDDEMVAASDAVDQRNSPANDALPIALGAVIRGAVNIPVSGDLGAQGTFTVRVNGLPGGVVNLGVMVLDQVTNDTIDELINEVDVNIGGALAVLGNANLPVGSIRAIRVNERMWLRTSGLGAGVSLSITAANAPTVNVLGLSVGQASEVVGLPGVRWSNVLSDVELDGDATVELTNLDGPLGTTASDALAVVLPNAYPLLQAVDLSGSTVLNNRTLAYLLNELRIRVSGHNSASDAMANGVRAESLPTTVFAVTPVAPQFQQQNAPGSLVVPLSLVSPIATVTWSASVDDPAVTAQVTGSTLRLSASAGFTGSVVVSVRATEVNGGRTADERFDLHVGVGAVYGNASGLLQNASGQPTTDVLEGLTVYLDQFRNGVFDAGFERLAVTDAVGNFVFTDLPFLPVGNSHAVGLLLPDDTGAVAAAGEFPAGGANAFGDGWIQVDGGADQREAYSVLLDLLNGNAVTGDGFVEFGGSLYFAVNSAQVWRFNGATVQNVYSGANPTDFVPFAGDLYFSAAGEIQRLSVDGNNQVSVQTVEVNAVGNSNPVDLAAFSNALYFGAAGTGTDRELWRITENVSGVPQVALVSNINAGASSDPQSLFVYDIDELLSPALYFSAQHATLGRELWRYDGVSAPQVLDIVAGAPSSSPVELAAYDGGGADFAGLYFGARRVNGGPVVPLRLRFSFNAAGLNTNWYNQTLTNPADYTVVGDALYLVADEPGAGREVFRFANADSNLTVFNVAAGATGSAPQYLVPFDNTLFFAANNGVSGSELWRVSGGAAAPVADIHPTGSAAPAFLTVFDDALMGQPTFGETLYMTATNGASAANLWRVGYTRGLASDVPTNATPIFNVGNDSELVFDAVQGLAIQVNSILGDIEVDEGDAVNFDALLSPLTLITQPVYDWRVQSSNGQIIPNGNQPAFGFTPTDNGLYEVTLTVHDAADPFRTISSMANVAVGNLAPQATIASGDGQFPAGYHEGDAITLNASVFDPGDDDFDYLWEVEAGNGQIIADGTAGQLMFAANGPGTYTVTLTVTDDEDAFDVTQVVLTVADVVPQISVNIVPGVTNVINEGGTFMAGGSFIDAPNDMWTATVNYGDGSGVQPLPLNPNRTFALSHAYADNPAIGTTYPVTVTVNDGTNQPQFNFPVTVRNVAPTATIENVPAGAFLEGNPITLVGSATDVPADLNEILFNWSVQASNGQLIPSGPGQLLPDGRTSFSFTPSDNGLYTVRLTAADAIVVGAADVEPINVGDVPPTVGLTIETSEPFVEGSPVQFSAEVTDPVKDSDEFTYLWAADGPNGQHVTGDDLTFGFTPNDDGMYGVSFRVFDGGLQVAQQNTSISVLNVAPVADINVVPAGPFVEGNVIMLGGFGMDVGVNDLLTRTWNVSAGNGQINFPAGNQAQYSFTAENDGEYVIELTVADDSGAMHTDTVQIVVGNVAPMFTLDDVSPAAVAEIVAIRGSATDPGISGLPGAVNDLLTATVDFDDGTVQSVALVDGMFNLNHQYVRTGDYDVTVTVDDGDAFPSQMIEVVVSDLTINAWRSSGLHGGQEATLLIPDDGSFSEPRQVGVRTLLVEFSEPINPASFTPGDVTVVGIGSNGSPVNLAGINIATSTRPGDTIGVITFSGPLPDYARYLVSVDGILSADADAFPLAGDTDRIITALRGDVTGDLRVNNSDVGALAPLTTAMPPVAFDPTNAEHVRGDIVSNGAFSAIDVNIILPLRGRDASAIPDPQLPTSPSPQSAPVAAGGTQSGVDLPTNGAPAAPVIDVSFVDGPVAEASHVDAFVVDGPNVDEYAVGSSPAVPAARASLVTGLRHGIGRIARSGASLVQRIMRLDESAAPVAPVGPTAGGDGVTVTGSANGNDRTMVDIFAAIDGAESRISRLDNAASNRHGASARRVPVAGGDELTRVDLFDPANERTRFEKRRLHGRAVRLDAERNERSIAVSPFSAVDVLTAADGVVRDGGNA
ncbi:MAG: hypothetical protein HOP29_10545, partial [Phycisphaerales bacterium]|nr:hypothetical protein [Phycisphaerales bacterium]